MNELYFQILLSVCSLKPIEIDSIKNKKIVTLTDNDVAFCYGMVNACFLNIKNEHLKEEIKKGEVTIDSCLKKNLNSKQLISYEEISKNLNVAAIKNKKDKG